MLVYLLGPVCPSALACGTMALRVLLASCAVASARFASWESHGELVDEEELKQKAVTQDFRTVRNVVFAVELPFQALSLSLSLCDLSGDDR